MRYGTANPEEVVSKLMTDLTSALCAGASCDTPSEMNTSEHGTSVPINHIKCRETVPGPRWTWERYGRMITMLADGRIVHIGGAHEMFCDPNFCIYNDVFVQRTDGRFSGHHDLREIGATLVMTLDARKFRMMRRR